MNHKTRSLPLTILKIILLILVCLIVLILVLVAIYMPRNKKAMNQGVDSAMDVIRRHAEVTEVDAGKYKKMRLMGIMNFEVHQYDVKDIGNLSVMTMNAGLMQMSTIILTPSDKDLPLVSTDYMYILGNRTSYLECYDLVLDKEGEYQNLLSSLKDIKKDYKDLDTITPSSAWYDDMRTVGLYMKGKSRDDSREEEALTRWIEAVMEYGENLPLLSSEEKEEKLPAVKEYTDGLVEKGGVSTDLFVKALGKEDTKDFFNNVLFGTNRSQ